MFPKAIQYFIEERKQKMLNVADKKEVIYKVALNSFS